MNISTFFSYQGSIPPLELELLQSFNRSIKYVYPDARMTVLTDRDSSNILNQAGFTTFVINVSPKTLLLDRLRGFRAFLRQLPTEAGCLMLDYDMLVLRDLGIFEQNIDVAYTTREQLSEQAINGGLVYYRNCERSLLVLNEIIKVYENLPKKDQQWWGDQLSSTCVFKNILGATRSGIYETQNVKILLMDAKKFNFTPFDMDISLPTMKKNLFIRKPVSEWIDADLSSIYLCHFKGSRKHLQLQFQWQMCNQGLYFDYITNLFYLHAENLEIAGSDYLSGLAMLNPSVNEVNDLAVLAYINFENIFAKSEKLNKISLIRHLKEHRDMRYMTLTSNTAPITEMK